MGVSEEGDVIWFILANKKKYKLEQKAMLCGKQHGEVWENGNVLVESNLLNSSFCSDFGKYTIGIRVKVLEKKDLWENKFKIMKYLVFHLCHFFIISK